MKLPPEAARWLVALRWIACLGVIAVTAVSAWVLEVVVNPWPLFGVALGMLAYNAVFNWVHRQAGLWDAFQTERSILIQILLDCLALTLLLYFADLPRNPFLIYFVFHMLIAGMYLRGAIPYVLAGIVSAMVGFVMWGEYSGWLPAFPLRLPSYPQGPPPLDELHLLGLFAAFCTALFITAYFSVSIRRYVDRAHAMLRQKEKMVGIGQLVAGFAHQIANPLDGLQNGLRRIGEAVKGDGRLSQYVRLMAEALERIERTAKRAQAFAQPHGITLQPTDVNAAVESTLAVLGSSPGPGIRIETDLREVPLVEGDPYTLQEVLFNLCTNAVAAMPQGGTLTLRTRTLGHRDDDQLNSVAIEVSDTGVGIPRSELEKIFEPFYTTRADAGGTGLGLSLCRMLISEMGGRIEVRSALGHGSTFTVVLNPYRPQKAESSAAFIGTARGS